MRVGRRRRDVDVMQSAQHLRLGRVDLDNDFVGGVHQIVSHTDGTRGNEIAVFVEPQRFDYRDIDRSEAAASEQPGHLAHLLLDVAERAVVCLSGEGAARHHGGPSRDQLLDSKGLVEPRYIGAGDQLE